MKVKKVYLISILVFVLLIFFGDQPVATSEVQAKADLNLANSVSSGIEDLPVNTSGLLVMLAWLIIAGLACASFKFPKKIALIWLIGNIFMTIIWYATPATAIIEEETPFTIAEGEGLVIHSSIYYDLYDPVTTTFNITIYDTDDKLLFEGKFISSTHQTGEHDEARYLPLSAGEYYYNITDNEEDHKITVYKSGVFAEMSHAYFRGLHVLFVSFSGLGMMIAVGRLIKKEKEE